MAGHLPRLGAFVAGALIAATACSGEGPLEPGNYRLAFTGADGWSQDMRLLVEPDGSFLAHQLWSVTDPTSPPPVCAGTLAQSEHVRLTDDLNEVDALFHGDSDDDECADQPVYRVTVTMVDDDGADGHRHSFRYGPCGSWSAPMRRLLETAKDIEHAHTSMGTCTDCPNHPALGDDCFRDPTSPGDFCRRGQRIECDEFSAGSIISCPKIQRECDPEVGWEPVVSLDFLEATLWRWLDTGTPTIRLAVMLQAFNPRGYEVAFPDPVPRLRLLDGAGESLPLGDDLAMSPADPLAPGEFGTYTVIIEGSASPELIDAATIELTLEPRSEYETPTTLPVAVIDGMP